MTSSKHRCLLWVVCMLIVLAPSIITAQATAGINVEFFQEKINEIRGEIRFAWIQAYSALTFAVIVALLGATIIFLGKDKFPRITRIIGAVVFILTGLTNLVFDGDYRDLKRRAVECEKCLDRAEMLVVEVSSDPPLIDARDFIAAFRMVKDTLWRHLDPDAYAWSGPSGDPGETVTLAGPPLPVSKKGEDQLRIVGISRSRHHSLAMSESVEAARKNATAYLVSQLATAENQQMDKDQLEKLAAYLVESAKVHGQNFEHNEQDGTYRAETWLILDKSTLLDDMTYFEQIYDTKLDKNMYMSVADAEGIPPEFFYRQDSAAVQEVTTDEVIVLHSAHSGGGVRMTVGPNQQLAALGPDEDRVEPFKLIHIDEMTVALQSAETGRYVRAGIGEGCFLGAVSYRIAGWETFRMIPMGEDRIALQSVQNNKFVRAGIGENSLLAAVSTSIGAWETFVMAPVE